jgi:hypothetical protein
MLWASAYMVWGFTALLLGLSILGVRVHREALQGIGRDTAPSIIHAQGIKAYLAVMDANVANELLGQAGRMQEEVDAYEENRKKVATSLIEAAKNITFEGEQEALENLQITLGTFEARVQRARDLREEGDARYLDAYRDAARIMDSQLLPETDKINDVNLKELRETYDRINTRSVGSSFLLVVSALILLGTLVSVQRFLTDRTHRVLNPLLVAATLVALWFAFTTYASQATARHRLRVAREDAFPSIHALLQARASAYSARSLESRYLLDPAKASEHENAFRSRMADTERNLQQELKNITFAEEEEPARATLNRFHSFLRVDEEMRKVNAAGNRDAALELCTGIGRGSAHEAFTAFDAALGRALEVNMSEFNRAVYEGFGVLSGFEWQAALVSLIIAGLAFFGLLQRIREYR